MTRDSLGDFLGGFIWIYMDLWQIYGFFRNPSIDFMTIRHDCCRRRWLLKFDSACSEPCSMREDPHRVLRGAESRKSCPETHQTWGHVHYVSPTKYRDFMGKYGDFMGKYGVSWENMVFHGKVWCFMGKYGVSWESMVIMICFTYKIW